MRRIDRSTARRQLDKRIGAFHKAESLERPPRGWVRAIRDALGMTSTQLALRLGVSQSRIAALEKAEVDQSVTLATLERAAHAMGCRFVYALVPKTTFAAIVDERAQRAAQKSLRATRHSMALEAQRVDPVEEAEQLKRIVRRLSEEGGSNLWKAEYD